ncbi:MAG TPA: 2-dehydropantoate 2-reductase [Plantibacter sp.]|uniref:ketopantoate reductase family protein n=1 Tax=unclassified Plantibacter TaxID=2624265 RepID=UPI002C67863B|nr:2-dehydropantoate 2-reductase [Plantibacter sp.]
MNILIVGAGATGLAVGVRLAQAGRNVTYLVRGERQRVIERDGITLTEPEGRHSVAAATVTADTLTSTFDLIIVSVKANAIVAVIEDIAPAVGPTTVIVPFLNGIRHIDLLDSRYPGRVAGGLIKIVATLDQHGGAVQMTPLAEITVGSLSAEPIPSSVRQLLDVPGLTVVEADDVWLRLWEKWAFIASAGIVTCLFDNAVGRVQEAGGLPYIHAAIRETEAIAGAAGFPPRGAAHAQSLSLLTEPGSPFTSSLFRDLTAGRVTEAEHILGDLADRARELAVPTPLLDLTLVRVRAAELSRVHSQP